MKFTTNSQVIQEGISIVTRALASRAPKAIFEGICMSVKDNTLTLTCSDGQFTSRWTGSVDVSDPGETVVPGRMVSELVRKLPSVPVTFSTADNAMLINYNKSRSRIAVISGDYPETRDQTDPCTITIPACDMKDLINHIMSCISTDDARPILTGGLLEVTPDTVSMVALDGFRLALKRIQTPNTIPDGKDRIRAVIPRKTLSEISRILPSSDEPISITLSSESIRFQFGNVQIHSVLLAGEYLDYARIIPTTYATSVRTDLSTIQNAVERASLMAREGKTKLIRFDIHQDSIAVSARAENGNIDEEFECSTIGNDITISFNSAYLSDAFRNIPGNTATLNFNSTSAPCVFTPESGDDWLYLILPVRTAT